MVDVLKRYLVVVGCLVVPEAQHEGATDWPQFTFLRTRLLMLITRLRTSLLQERTAEILLKFRYHGKKLLLKARRWWLRW